MILVDPFQLSVFYGSMIYQGLFCLVYVWWFMFAAGSAEGSTGSLDLASQTTAPSAFIATPALSQTPSSTEPPTLPILFLCRAGLTLLATSQGCCEESSVAV